MTEFMVSDKVAYFFIFIILSLGVMLYMAYRRYMSFYDKDKVLMIDSNNRWEMIDTDSKGKDRLEIGKYQYKIVPDSALINSKGKTLYIYSQNKPIPMAIKYNKSEWLSSESIKGILNNDLISMIVKANSTSSIIFLLGAVGGIIAGVAAIFNLMKIAGII